MITICIIAVVLTILIRWLDAIKSGSYYAASRQEEPSLLKRFMDNMHYVQTPMWYCIHGLLFILLYALFKEKDPSIGWMNALAAGLISHGASVIIGPVYQGYINVGGGEPFIDPNEKPYIDFAIPIVWKRIHIPKFWYGKRRIYLAFIGIIEVVIGFLIIF